MVKANQNFTDSLHLFHQVLNTSVTKLHSTATQGQSSCRLYEACILSHIRTLMMGEVGLCNNGLLKPLDVAVTPQIYYSA